MHMLRAIIFLALLVGARAAATGADSLCDAVLKSHFKDAKNDCAASSGVCPSSCLAAMKELETACAGKKYTKEETRNGQDVELALSWDTDKARYLILYQTSINLGLTGSDDACNEVIHDYQISSINDCEEAYKNAAVDIVYGYYCESPQSDSNTCHVNCQETIDKLEAICNPTGGPLGKYYLDEDQDTATKADDVFMEYTYSSAIMLGLSVLGPDACSYTTSAPSSTSVPPATAVPQPPPQPPQPAPPPPQSTSSSLTFTKIYDASATVTPLTLAKSDEGTELTCIRYTLTLTGGADPDIMSAVVTSADAKLMGAKTYTVDSLVADTNSKAITGSICSFEHFAEKASCTKIVQGLTPSEKYVVGVANKDDTSSTTMRLIVESCGATASSAKTLGSFSVVASLLAAMVLAIIN